MISIRSYTYTDRGGVYGIVSIGDFRRSLFFNQPLIQTKFSYVTEAEEDHAKQILLENSNIFAVPVLDEKRQIVKEYRKKNVKHDILDNDSLFRLYRNFMLLDGGRSLVISRFESEAQRWEAEQILCKTSGKLTIVDEADIADINEYISNGDYQVIYDCIHEQFLLREVIYIKLGIKYYNYNITYPEKCLRPSISDEKTSIASNILCKVFWQFVRPAEEGRSLIITKFENGRQRQEAEKLMCKVSGNLAMIDERDIVDIGGFMKNTDYQRVYDCVPEHFWIRERM